ncbi:Putative WRKY transcription factor 70 [Glycine soja]|nr:Putative WRKY transcription factor 70 [Glycine soja]
MNNIVCFASEISVSTQKKRVIIEELLKGQEAATQLKVLLLEKPFWSEASLSFQEVMDNVLRSFSEALSILNSSSSSEPAGSAAEVAHRSLLNSGQPEAASGEKRFQKDGRGRYNRRSYFRCGYKYDQGCKANKQVQRDQENPNMYRITYIGIHTCNATPKATHSATDSNTWESFLLNSDGEVPNSPSLTIKQQFPKESTSSLI